MKTAVLSLTLALIAGAGEAAGQELKIGIVDFYGLSRVSPSEARQALTFKEGDSISLDADGPPAFISESERQLSTLPGVLRAHVSAVCCDAGRVIVYVGIEERGQATLHFHAAPLGGIRLEAEIVQAGKDLSEAGMAAAQRGDASEDDSQGHAFFHDPAARALQERFVSYAARDRRQLRSVLRNSSDAEHRALAAQVLGYVANKQEIVGDLVFAMSDPAEDVRNNAMRALSVFARMSPGAARPIVRVPYEPFIALLNSPVWTDRNKASLALMGISERRDPALLTQLRREAVTPLVEMARWKSKGHALPALLILGRISGQSDDAVEAAWTRGDQEVIINAVLKQRAGS